VASNDVKRSLLRIGLKFCGGCNPEFDRGSVANGIAQGLKGKATVVPFEEEDLDAVIAIEGCPTACADLDPFSELPIYRITSEEEGLRFVDRVIKGLFP
jgi:ferredoxin